MRLSLLIGGTTAILVQGCADTPSATQGEESLARQRSASATALTENGKHLVIFGAERVPEDFAARVASLGGAIELSLPGIGVATVAGLGDAAAADLADDSDIRAVERNTIVSMTGIADAAESSESAADALSTASAAASVSPAAARFYARQWNMRAIFADEAWNAGYMGSTDVVVALLDSGLDYLHPDFDGLVDLNRSISFVPEDDPIIAARFPGRLPITDLAWHGTAVASVIGNKGTLLAGVNRDVTYIVVKIFNRRVQGTADRALAGIMYAADNGADVINLSGNFTFDKSENPGTIAAFQRAVNYAFRQGALVVSAAGNDAADLDHDGDRVRLPCQAANAICVRATGPTAAAGLNGPWENVDAPAPFSGFGRSAISVAAPTGTGDTGSGRRIWVLCSRTTTESLAPACFSGQPMAQPSGTSFAVAHVSGLAAQLFAQRGAGNVAAIREAILNSADDLGAPGVDPFYGRGRVNVARALGLR